MIIKTQLSDGSFSYEHLNIDIEFGKNTIQYKIMLKIKLKQWIKTLNL